MMRSHIDGLGPTNEGAEVERLRAERDDALWEAANLANANVEAQEALDRLRGHVVSRLRAMASRPENVLAMRALIEAAREFEEPTP